MATEKSTGDSLVGTLVTIAMAKAEGWYSKTGSKWKTMPEQMLKYRAASWLVRAYAPEIAMGLHCADEIEDSQPKANNGSKVALQTVESLLAADEESEALES